MSQAMFAFLSTVGVFAATGICIWWVIFVASRIANEVIGLAVTMTPVALGLYAFFYFAM